VNSILFAVNKTEAKSGFTLLETIVALLIFGIISTILFSTFLRIQRKIYENKMKNQLAAEGVKICNTIRRELTGARELYYGDQDSIFFVNPEGDLSSFYWKDSLFFSSDRSLVLKGTRVPSFKFIYYLPPESEGESSQPVSSLPLDAVDLIKVKVIDWEIELKKGATSLQLKTGICLRGTR